MEITLDLNEAINFQKKLNSELGKLRKKLLCSKDEEERDKLLDEYEYISNSLVKIKVKIREKNIQENISENIYKLSELKSLKEILVKTRKVNRIREIEKEIIRLERLLRVSNSFTTIAIDKEMKKLVNILNNTK